MSSTTHKTHETKASHDDKTRDKGFGYYHLTFLDKLFLRLRMHIVTKHVNFNGKSVVDVWSGFRALNLQYLQSCYKMDNIAALDLNLDEKELEAKWIQCLIGDLEVRKDSDQKFDIVLGTAIMEHIQNDQGFIESCYAMLKPGGKLVLTTPSKRSQPVLEFLAYKLHVIEEVEIRDHKRYYTKAMLIECLKKAGFKESHIHHEYFELGMNNFVIATK